MTLKHRKGPASWLEQNVMLLPGCGIHVSQRFTCSSGLENVKPLGKIFFCSVTASQGTNSVTWQATETLIVLELDNSSSWATFTIVAGHIAAKCGGIMSLNMKYSLIAVFSQRSWIEMSMAGVPRAVYPTMSLFRSPTVECPPCYL